MRNLPVLAMTVPVLFAVLMSAQLPAQVWIEDGDAGDLPGTAQSPEGSSLTQIDGFIDALGGDRDMYLIQIDDPLSFEATTVFGSLLDTQLCLFDSDGFGVALNDDDPLGVGGLSSRISGLFVPGPGLYYLAVSTFDVDPTAAGSEIWMDEPFGAERAPDGPGAAGMVDGWTGTSFGDPGAYSIFLTGVSAPVASSWTEVGDAGDLPFLAQVPVGSGPLDQIDGTIDDPSIPAGAGNDRDMYLIRIDDPAAFEATTSAPMFNMQMFLFTAHHIGVTHNDNNPSGMDLNPRITGQFLPGPGLYFLAVSRFDRDPTAGGLEIWNDLPLDDEQAATGPGVGRVNGWNGDTISAITGPYSILLTGATFAAPPDACSVLMATGGAPGTNLDFTLLGAEPDAFLVFAMSSAEGYFAVNLSGIALLELGLAPPVGVLPVGTTDPNGVAVRRFPIPPNFPFSLDLFAQMFTAKVQESPPSVSFCTSSIEAFHVGAEPFAQTLFGTDANGGNLIKVDTATGAGTVVGFMGSGPAPSLAIDPTTGTMYGGGGGGNPAIYTIDPTTGVATFLGDSGLGVAAIGGLDVAPDGTLFAAVNIVGAGGTGSDNLAIIDKTTGFATVVGPFGATIDGIEGIAFDAAGTLWGSLSARGAAGSPGLYTIDVATGAATFVAPIVDGLGVPASGGVVSLQFVNGTLYGGTARALSGSDGGRLVTIDPATGIFAFVGSVSATGGSSLGGLAFAPSGSGK